MILMQIDAFPNHITVNGNPSEPNPQVLELQQQLVAAENEARDTGALLELLAKVQIAPSLKQACCLLVNDLRAYLNCGTLAVALRRGTRSGSSLRSISSMVEFDGNSELVRQYESACDEAVFGGRSTMWPSPDDSQRHATMALKTLGTQTGATSAVCELLRTTDGEVVGSWLMLNIDPAHDQRTRNLLHAFASPVANCLAGLQHRHRSLIGRVAHFVGAHIRTRLGWIVATLLGLLVAIMLVPVTHRIKCVCRLEPVTHRFVAAPFDGTLEETLVEPGDVVEKGALLARLDGRELRWKQAELVAERARAVKQRDAELATGKFGAAQISKLEMQRIDLQIQLLKHREDNLEIRSPIAGVVTSGDLQRAVGAPVSLGQSLFEVAPLDAMLVEMAIPQEDIRFVKPTLSVNVQLDSLAGETWELKVDRVRPRAEIRDQHSVFIATALMENEEAMLRPGMEGHAWVLCPKRPVGWLLFHKPWDAMRSWTGW